MLENGVRYRADPNPMVRRMFISRDARGPSSLLAAGAVSRELLVQSPAVWRSEPTISAWVVVPRRAVNLPTKRPKVLHFGYISLGVAGKSNRNPIGDQ